MEVFTIFTLYNKGLYGNNNVNNRPLFRSLRHDRERARNSKHRVDTKCENI